MRTISLRESGTSVVQLCREDARWLQKSGAANVLLGPEKGLYKVHVGNVAGLISNGAITVEIEPKMHVGEMMWLLSYAATGVKLREENVAAAPTDCVEALAVILAKFVGDVVAGGLPRGYREVEETGPTLRGRLRFDDQLARHHGRLNPLEQSFHEFGPNIAENQIMRAACARSLQCLAAAAQPSTGEVQSKLRRLLREFASVDSLVPGAPLPLWRRSAQNRQAWPAIELAEMILRGGGVDVLSGQQDSLGLVIDMPRVFEAAVARGLDEVSAEWTVRSQNARSLSKDGRHTVRPDIIMESGGKLVAVADTKYKDGAVSVGDLYQMFTYASLFGVDRAHLIYSTASSFEAPIGIGETGVSIHSHGLSLAQPSKELLAQLREMATTLV